MVLPFVLRTATGHGHHAVAVHGANVAAGLTMGSGDLSIGLTATVLHTAGYLLVTGLLATLVYSKLGLRRLRELWINLDLVWGSALIVTGVITPLL